MMAHSPSNPVSVQQALAMLVVNPAASLRLLETRCPSSVGLEIPDQEQGELVSFLDTHGRAFRTSVLLLRKRRLDNVVDTLTVVPRVFSEYELACYWDDYLASIAIGAPSPMNPLLESIQFCRFVLDALAPNDPHSALVAYDLARNEVMAAVASDEATYRHDPRNDDPALWAPLVHPSARVEVFPTNVGAMVKLLTQGGDRNRVLATSNGQPETVLFFKNWTRGGVGSMRLNAAAKDALVLLDGRGSAQALIDECPAIASLLKAMTAAGAIARVTIREMHDER